MRDVKKEIEYCVDLISVIYDVPPITEIKISGRMTRTFGKCVTHRVDDGYTKLIFAKFLFEDNYPRDLELRCIAHELAHSIDRNKHDHRREWREIAETISDCYPFLGDIQRYTNKDECKAQEVVKPKKEYKVKCLACGRAVVHKGYRAPKWYSQTERYHCKCGGRLKKIV